MEKNGYTFNDYMGKNIVGNPCHTYELRKNGKVIYSLNVSFNEDGTEPEAAVKHFYEKADQIMDSIED